MPKFNFIDNLDDPLLKPFLRLCGKKPWLHDRPYDLTVDDQILVAENIKVVTRLLESDLSPISILAIPEYFKELAPLLKRHHINPEYLLTTSKPIISKITGYRVHQGIMALAHQPKPLSLNDLKPPYLILNSLNNAENVGALVRTALAFNIRSIIIDNKCASPYLRRSIKTSMGSIFFCQLHVTDNLPKTLEDLKEKGTQVLGAHLDSNSLHLQSMEPNHNFAVVMGTEGDGLAQDVVDACSATVKIPICKELDSLNVATAGSIFMYHMTANTPK